MIVRGGRREISSAYAKQTTEQTLYATVGGGTITVRNNPTTSLDGLNRDKDNPIKTENSSTDLKVAPVLGTINSIVTVAGLPQLVKDYTAEKWAPADGQAADAAKRVADKNKDIPEETVKKIDAKLKELDAQAKEGLLDKQQLADKKNDIIRSYSNEKWYPAPIGEPGDKGYGAKLTYDYEKIKIQLFGSQK